MNQLMLIVVVLVAFVYFGGSKVPSVLKKNKEILLGLAGGLVLCSFFGLRLEGFRLPGESDDYTTVQECVEFHGGTQETECLAAKKAHDCDSMAQLMCSRTSPTNALKHVFENECGLDACVPISGPWREGAGQEDIRLAQQAASGHTGPVPLHLVRHRQQGESLLEGEGGILSQLAGEHGVQGQGRVDRLLAQQRQG